VSIAILHPARWRRQPPGRPEIDWASPFARGLVALVDPRHGDLVSRTAMSFSGTAVLTGGRHGIGVTTDDTTGADSGYVVLPSTHPMYSLTTTYSAWIFARQVSSGSYGNILSVPYRAGAWAAPFNALTIFNNSGVGGLLQLQDSSGNSVQGAAWSATQQQYLGVRDGTSMRLFVDGRQSGSATGAATAVNWNTKQPLVLLRNSWESGASPTGVLGTAFLAGIWARVLTAAEIAALYENPWAALFRPQTQSRVYILGAGGGNLSVTVDSADLTLTGQSVAVAQSVAVTAATLGLAGQTVTLPRAVGVTAGTLALTGQTIGVPISMGVTAAALTFTGQAIGVPLSMAVTAAALALAGQDVTLTNTADTGITVAVDAGTLTLTGQAIVLPLSMAVTRGTLTLAGQDVTIAVGGSLAVPVTHGTLTLTGQPIGLTLSAAARPERITWSLKRRSASFTLARRQIACALTHRTVTLSLAS
jgi:hypothetical protein